MGASLSELVSQNMILRGKLVRQQEQLEGAYRVQEQLREQNARLEQRIVDLEMRLRSDSQSSGRPPSSDLPFNRAERRKRAKEDKKKKRGAKPGHKGSRRAWVSMADAVQEHVPEQCEDCGASLQDAIAERSGRQQVSELPEMHVRVTEHRKYAKRCTSCGHRTRAKLPKRVAATGSFGPQLRAVLALMTGSYRISRRTAKRACKQLFGLEISRGALSANERLFAEHLQGTCEDAHRWMQRSPVLFADETTLPEQHRLRWLWAATDKKVTVYKVQDKRNKAAASALLGEFKGLLHTDRLGSYNVHPEKKRQLCWAHLRRDIRALQEHPETKDWANPVAQQIDAMFHTWHRVRDGTVPKRRRRIAMGRIQDALERRFEHGQTHPHKRVRTVSTQALKRWKMWWRFVLYETEPTNNHAERALRPAVLWRKTSLGTQSNTGTLFFERMMTTCESLRLQGRDVLAFLQLTLEQASKGVPLPLLTPGL